METYSITAIAATAALLGFVHTLLGPDHYLPFIAMSRARNWSLSKTMAISSVCGLGHVAGSVVIGLVGIGLGVALGSLDQLETLRGTIAGWLLLGFGLAYMAWGIHRAIRNRPHTHVHLHGNGSLHRHLHTHSGEHVHVHETEGSPSNARPRNITPWVLFTIFVFGPCESLIPLLMVPASAGNWAGVGFLALVFGACTIATMLGVVYLGYQGISRLSFGKFENYSHALSGMVIFLCGVAVQFGL